MTRLLVTGGSGFIGTNLVEQLVKKGYEVLNIDTARPLNEVHFQYWSQIDILDFDSLQSKIQEFNPEIIVHLAAVTDLNGKNLEYYKANTEGTKNIIEISNKLPLLKKVIFTSSMYVCKPGYIPQNYNDYKPHTLYGESKVEGEKIVKAVKDTHYSWTIVRPTSIWGPWFNIPYIDFFNIVYQGKYFDFGNTCTKTYGFVDNTVYQIEKIIAADHLHGKTFYLGDYTPIQISEWANEISLEMGKGPIKRIPFFLIQGAAWIGDVLSKMNLKFPISSFRLTNMTTNNVLPLNDLFEVTGTLPVNRHEGVRNTIEWLVDVKGYKIRNSKGEVAFIKS
ncbi:NAD-dependent epimerase/dehydratase family protein [Pontibacter harenae]|uniref:NAD-dependent epimerase/dehydratase family protein n=1 Tax=Pontibacter harenae TaxID=2894083 RepID=UPI001E4C0656|nr:NAD(P)-dependent oxidoreductase [Pontibacter harenae]MCC9167212.1 NAD(P)-dependent oxidoreductase [Pontibacter harenae]